MPRACLRAKAPLANDTLPVYYYRALDSLFADRRSHWSMRYFEHLKHNTGIPITEFMTSRVYEWQERGELNSTAVY